MAKIRKRANAWKIDYFDPGGKRVRKSFKKKKEAEAELGKRVSLIAEGRYLDVKVDTKTTLADLVERYVEHYKNQEYFLSLKRYVIDILRARFSGRMLSSITYYDCEDFLTERRNTPTWHGKLRTASTLNKEVGTLRHMFKKAVSWGMLDKSPFDRGESLRLKENNQRLRFLSEEEIEALLPQCSDYLREIVEVDLLTGMRRKELLSLRWSQITGGFIYLDKTKTAEARQLPIPEDLDAALKRIKRRQWGRGIKSEHVFCNDRGERFTEIKKAFGAVCRRAGITDFRFHDLRHTFASHYLMRGGNLRGLQKRLGHRDIRRTMRYAHLSREFDT